MSKSKRSSRIICGVTDRHLSNMVNKILVKEQAVRDASLSQPNNSFASKTTTTSKEPKTNVSQHSNAVKTLVDPLTSDSADCKVTTLKMVGNPIKQTTDIRKLQVPEGANAAGTLKILTMSKEEVKQIVHDTITNHPKIQAMDKKLTRLLYIVEHQNSYQNKINYFPIKDHDMMAQVEEVLLKSSKEQIEIMNLFRQWTGTSTSCPALNEVFKKVFHDDYLSECNLTGAKNHKSLTDNAVLQILSDIWIENGSSLQEFTRKARLCIRYAHNRFYVRRQRSLKNLKRSAESSYHKDENTSVEFGDHDEEFLDSEENDEL